MTTTFTMPQIPDKLTDTEARALLEKHAPDVRAVADEIVRNNTRAEEGDRNYRALMNKANDHFGTPDESGKKVVAGGEEGVKRILEERMTTNAQRVRDFLSDFESAKEKLAAITKNSPAR